MSDLVSVIMPAYNAAEYISTSIQSVIAQTYKAWELIVVDDGSTDSTRDVVQRLCEVEPRVKYIYQENSRQGKARNVAIQIATGKFIAFLDSDDLWLPSKLETQIDVIHNTGVDLVFSNSYLFTGVFDSSEASTMTIDAGILAGLDGVEKLLVANRVPILTALCKRESILRAGCFTEAKNIQNAEDYHLWLKMQIIGCKFFGTSNVLAAYREHSSSVSSLDRSNLKQLIEAQYDLYKNYVQYRRLIYPYLIKNIKFNLFRLPNYTDIEFYSTIKTYIKIYKKTYLLYPIYFVEKLRMRSFALKYVYFIFNYL